MPHAQVIGLPCNLNINPMFSKKETLHKPEFKLNSVKFRCEISK